MLICVVAQQGDDPAAHAPVAEQLREVRLLPVRVSRGRVGGAGPAAAALHGGEGPRRGTRVGAARRVRAAQQASYRQSSTVPMRLWRRRQVRHELFNTNEDSDSWEASLCRRRLLMPAKAGLNFLNSGRMQPDGVSALLAFTCQSSAYPVMVGRWRWPSPVAGPC